MAGMMLISSPDLIGVFWFCRKRMSSSLTYTLTKRRMLPFSSSNFCAKFGYCDRKAAIASKIIQAYLHVTPVVDANSVDG